MICLLWSWVPCVVWTCLRRASYVTAGYLAMKILDILKSCAMNVLNYFIVMVCMLWTCSTYCSYICLLWKIWIRYCYDSPAMNLLMLAVHYNRTQPTALSVLLLLKWEWWWWWFTSSITSDMLSPAPCGTTNYEPSIEFQSIPPSPAERTFQHWSA